MQHQFVVHGFDVVAVDNGKDAFLQLQEETFDAAILDILMPKMDGLEVLKALCKQKRAHMVPIFVFSNLAQEVDVKTAKKYGIVEYVIKADVAIDEVVAKIEKHLKKQT